MDHQLIKEMQHDFIPGISCLTNLLTFLERMTSYLDSSFPVDVIYLDISKTFDKAHGIGDNIHRWIGEWLKDRKQRVVMRGQKSEWSLVKSRVSQGLVLEPLFFTMYINDIDDNIASHILKFVDEAKDFFSKVAAQEEINSLQEDLNKLYHWSE